MTAVYITIDTEYSHSLASRKRPVSRAENFARSISCVTPDGPAGVEFKLGMFNRHGLKGVFFVDPMPALLYGVEAITDVVRPILEHGHDVQLHLHTEWLDQAGPRNPLGTRTGRNMRDFTFEEQCVLIDYAKHTLMAAGAPEPVAFRAGNYGANDDTLRALAEIGIKYDSSHCPGIANSECSISLCENYRRPYEHCGVIEVPIGCIEELGGGLRHAQITALSAWEMIAALKHAREENIANFTFVSHSFELLCRKRERVNKLVRRRFDKLCAGIEAMDGVYTATYADNPPVAIIAEEPRPVLPVNELRAGLRMAEQVVVNTLYGA
ncbi:MAG: hypothetical protein R3E18_10275 [Sphingomonadaceae bacterium]|nr:polysaccharide deacetylase family protein [Sphingomonadaceae bacterium]